MTKKSPEEEHPIKAFGWAARHPNDHLSPFNFSRRATGDEDVRFKVLYCGICHSDLHAKNNDWGLSLYPMVPGHEIVGEVTEVGKEVKKVKVGDKVGVGCMVGAYNNHSECEECKNDLENYCPSMILTYSATYHDGTLTYGGYSDHMVVNQHYVVRFPDSMPLDSGAPLLCAGVTVYSPLKYFELAHTGKRLGVVGLGGLGHLAVKFAKAFGAHVTVISTSTKKDEALHRLGADSFLVSTDQQQMKEAARSLDGIMDTVSANYSLSALLALLKLQGKLIIVGAPDKPFELQSYPDLAMGRKIVGGSGIGGMKETQEMIDFAAKHKVSADIEVIPMNYVNTAMERLAKGDVRYRFVIDVANTLDAATRP